MKKLILSTLSFCLVAFMLTSCASKKGTTANYKVSKSTITGTWTVSDVSLVGFPSGYNVTKAFGMASYKDFIGSTWKLYGGYSGYITLANGTTQNIYWDLLNDGVMPIFQFKKIDAGEKAKNVTEGYKMNIDAASKSSLTLSSPIELLNGHTAKIVYTLNAQ
jgi:hypothetical protein|nr:hypothetical protein [uncultured Pedobacter sp.]